MMCRDELEEFHGEIGAHETCLIGNSASGCTVFMESDFLGPLGRAMNHEHALVGST